MFLNSLLINSMKATLSLYLQEESAQSSRGGHKPTDLVMQHVLFVVPMWRCPCGGSNTGTTAFIHEDPSHSPCPGMESPIWGPILPSCPNKGHLFENLFDHHVLLGGKETAYLSTCLFIICPSWEGGQVSEDLYVRHIFHARGHLFETCLFHMSW